MSTFECRIPEYLEEIREAARLAARCEFLEQDLVRERERRERAEADRDDYRRRLALAETERGLAEGFRVGRAHARDEDCTVNPDTDSCETCGVYHGDPCDLCGGAGYHREGCEEIEG